MNKIGVKQVAPQVLTIHELKVGEFYIGLTDDADPPDVLYVASEAGAGRNLAVDTDGTPYSAQRSRDAAWGEHTCLVRLRDGYILLGLVGEYTGYIHAQVDLTAHPA